VESKSINTIIGNDDIKTINIPIFQRPYRWETTQLTQFLNDFDNVLERDEDSDYHFLGLIVYVINQDDESSKTIDIIDGQQRLATIFIFISVIRDLLLDFFTNNVDLPDGDRIVLGETYGEFKQILQKEKNIDSRPKLDTENEAFLEKDFLQIIQKSWQDFEEDGNDEIISIYNSQPAGSRIFCEAKLKYMKEFEDGRRTVAKKSYKNYKAIYEHIDNKLKEQNRAVDRLNDLFEYFKIIKIKFRAIGFELNNYEKAFEYFEVLNDRGLEVSALDLIKNHSLRKCENKEEREAVFQLWNAVFSETLSEDYNLIMFIRYAYMSRKGHITKKDIYSSYSRLFNAGGLDELKSYLSDILKNQAEVFKVLSVSDQSMPSLENEIKLHNIIEILRSTKTQQWYSIAIAVLTPVLTHRYDLSPSNEVTKIVNIFEQLHEIMFSLNYSDKVANKIEKKFPEISKIVHQENDKEQYLTSLDNVLDEIIQTKGDQKLSFKDIELENLSNSDFFKSSNDLGNMLILLFHYKMEGGQSKIIAQTLEHVLPQSIKQSEWPEFFRLNSAEKQKSIYSLGNFMNASSSNNSKYKNKSFKTKKDKYDTDVFDPLKGTDLSFDEISDDGWTEELIQEREDKLIERFKTQIRRV